MTSLRKKLMLVLFAALAAVCLIAGVIFTAPVFASAETTEPVVLKDDADFNFSNTKVITGLSDTAKEKIGDDNYIIEISGDVEGIGARAFHNQKNLVEVRFAPTAALKEIGMNAFAGCTNLQNVIFPTSQTTSGTTAEFKIQSSAFNGCTSFTAITIPAHVTTIAVDAFAGCTSVEQINYYAINCNTMVASPFTGLNAAKNVKVNIGSEGGSTITYIPTNLFNRTNISEVSIHNVNLNETAFKDTIFAECKSLTKVEFNDDCGITSIGAGVFNGCTALSDINLDPLTDLTTIGDNAFYGCSSLYQITVPSDVSSIGAAAFQGCIRLVEVNNLSTLKILAGESTISNNATPTATVFESKVVKHVYNATKADETTFIKNDPDNGDYIFYEDTEKPEKLLIGYVGALTALELPVGDYKIHAKAFSGNTALTKVTIPQGVSEVGDEAFSGCTALNNVIYNENTNISKISSKCFEGCTSLVTINIPASVRTIDSYAFLKCTALKNVNFAVKDKLTQINNEAFSGCTALEVIELPASVTAFGANIFKGCQNLSVVYLPTRLNNFQVSGLFDTVISKGERLLIAPSYSSYDEYSSYSSTWDKYGTLTYEVPVYLVYGSEKQNHFYQDYNAGGGNAEHHIEYKLAGLDYGYKKDGNVWTNDGKMPVQHGYAESVWYRSPLTETVNTVVGPDELNEMLHNDGDHVTHLSLYANYYDYTEFEFTLQEAKTYSESEQDTLPAGLVLSWKNEDDSYNISTDSTKFTNMYSVEIVEYVPVVAGTVSSLPEKVSHAGTYTIRVNLNKNTYGLWDAEEARTYIEKDYVVNPVTLDLDNQVALSDYITWKVVDGNELSASTETTLYVYGDNKTPYSQPQPNLGEVTEEKVINSYLMYVSAGWTIGLNVPQKYITAITQYDSPDNNVTIKENGIYADAPGTYTAQATFVSNNDYRFQYKASGNNPYGLTISETKTAEGYEYVVTKIWYIVTADASELLAREGGIYDMSAGWTYGSKVPGAPYLSSSITHGMEERLITFTLENEVIFGTPETLKRYTYAEYDDVINSSMPVGTYTLTIYVETFTTGTGSNATTVAGNGKNGKSWTFDVSECNIDDLLVKLKNENKLSGTSDLWGNLYDNQSVKKSFEAEYQPGIVQFASTSGVPVLKLDEKDIHNRQGIWKGTDYDKYYGKFIIEYNVETASGGISSNNYYTAENYINGPSNPGKYTVYFNVTANNYTNKINIDNETDRKQFYYTLYIKQYLDLSGSEFNLGPVPYTGSAIRFNDTDIYKFVYVDGSATDTDTLKAIAINGGAKENYVNAGENKTVYLMIRSNVSDYYGWKNGNNKIIVYSQGTANEQTFVRITFEIERSDNRSTTPLYLKDWEWGTVGEDEFDIQWSTQYVYGTNADFTFILQSKKNPSDIYYYQPTGTQLGFDKADAGEYTLIATAAGGEGYNWKALREERPVTILQSKVTLKNSPYIESWKYGDYATMYQVPEYELSAGFSSLANKITSYVTKLSDYNEYLGDKSAKDKMTVWLTVEDMRDANGEVPAGSYVYVYELPESGNYAEWSHEVYFSVLQVNNYWDTTPTVHDWVYGDYSTRDTSIDCVPHFGNKSSVIYYYRYTGVSGWVTSIPEDWFDKYGELSVGQYEFRAYLKGNENYADLDTYMYFNVTAAKNSWLEDGIPGVTSWSYGNWNSSKNAMSAQAKYGEVTFAVYSAKDTERKHAYDINKLNSLGVGSYVLVATVEGTSDYDKLVGEATFAVFEDSVGMTGIIAATVVFAVIAIGLAVGGIVLLIIRNKKIEEEFRKMIKSELRRK